ncbi:MAG TPA: tetratricopeptide repeat protein [Polyangiales bacterium]|nr:tetratricopeptide repeat protein [Polyangiales bacterium]
MTREAPDGSAHALFAHRHLAELQLSGSPWRAALHLRRLVQAGAADDSAHALMGLSQALLGNYRMAVGAYRRAIKLAPRNPWYHHNLGHLLDVGLSDSVAALEHLRMAHRIQPEEDEIAASLAHCLARLGQLKEAQLMAQRAVRRSPRNREHAALLEWIKSGAPSNVVPSARVDSQPRGNANGNGSGAGTGSGTGNRKANRGVSPSTPTSGSTPTTLEVDAASTQAGVPHAQHNLSIQHDKHDKQDKQTQDTNPANGSVRPARPALKAAPVAPPVLASVPSVNTADDSESGELTPALGRVLSMLETYGEAPTDASDPGQYLQLARNLWVDFCAQRQPRVQKPAVYAAAVEYTLSRLANRAITQAQLARRYGVTARAIAARHEEICQTLAIEPGDPRYLGKAK